MIMAYVGFGLWLGYFGALAWDHLSDRYRNRR